MSGNTEMYYNNFNLRIREVCECGNIINTTVWKHGDVIINSVLLPVTNLKSISSLSLSCNGRDENYMIWSTVESASQCRQPPKPIERCDSAGTWRGQPKLLETLVFSSVNKIIHRLTKNRVNQVLSREYSLVSNISKTLALAMNLSRVLLIHPLMLDSCVCYWLLFLTCLRIFPP